MEIQKAFTLVRYPSLSNRAYCLLYNKKMKKIKLDFQINQNIYYRTGVFFIAITILINVLNRLELIPSDLYQLRLFSVSIGIPFYFYGIFYHYTQVKDLFFIKQTLLGLLIGLVILILIHYF